VKRAREISALLVLAVGLTAGCGGSDRRRGVPGTDGGTTDAGAGDAGRVDAGPLDGGADCGNGTLDDGEQCDLGTLNGAAGSCCTSACAFRVFGEVCREGSGDVCDPDETCDGASPTCPEDEVSPATTVCRVAGDEGCDPAEQCTGVAGEPCPADEVASDGTSCTGNGESECSGADTCRSGVCEDNDLGAGTACGAGVDEPTCDPDVCDGSGACTDVGALTDGAACSDGGGDTCCGGACVTGAPSTGMCDPCSLPTLPAATVTIVESRSMNAGHDMDLQWETVATGMGLSASIVEQTALDSTTSLASTDILIVSSGTIALSATRISTVVDFLSSGGAVYLQAEYQTTYDSNQAFAQAVTDLGGTFTWSSSVTGSLSPAVSGCLATEPETIAELTYFHYGATGSGTGVDAFLSEGSQPVGWTFCPTTTGAGYLVSTTDQDWVRQSGSYPAGRTLMRNILHRLAFPDLC